VLAFWHFRDADWANYSGLSTGRQPALQVR